MQVSSPTINAAGASGAQPAPLGKLQKAASDFEALLLGQMLKSARESGEDGSDGEDSESNSSLMDLSEQQFAQTLANNGGLGIAKMVVAGLKTDANR